MRREQTPSTPITIERVQRALITAATLVDIYGDIYLPIFERAEKELAILESQGHALARARQIVRGSSGAPSRIPQHVDEPIYPNDQEVTGLWLNYTRLRAEHQALMRDIREAQSHLPWWAQSGPKYLHSDGTIGGDIVHWPAIQHMAPPAHPALFRNLRPSRAELEQYWTHDYLGDIGRKQLDAALRALDARLAAVAAEEARLGLPELNARDDIVYDAMWKAAKELGNLPPATPLAVGAQLLLDCLDCEVPELETSKNPECEVCLPRLRSLQPYLFGPLADDVAVFLNAAHEPIPPDGFCWLGHL